MFNIFENLSKATIVKGEGSQFASGELLGGGGSGLGGLKDTGIFSKICDAIFAGADAHEAFAAFASLSNPSSGGGEASGGGDGGGGGGGSSNAIAFPATVGAAQGAINAGMLSLGEAPTVGNYSPSNTPGMGKGAGMGAGMGV